MFTEYFLDKHEQEDYDELIEEIQKVDESYSKNFLTHLQVNLKPLKEDFINEGRVEYYFANNSLKARFFKEDNQLSCLIQAKDAASLCASVKEQLMAFMKQELEYDVFVFTTITKEHEAELFKKAQKLLSFQFH